MNGLSGIIVNIMETERPLLFPLLSIIPVEEEEVGTLLSFGTSMVSKKSLYTVIVKVLKRTFLVGAS